MAVDLTCVLSLLIGAVQSISGFLLTHANTYLELRGEIEGMSVGTACSHPQCTTSLLACSSNLGAMPLKPKSYSRTSRYNNNNTAVAPFMALCFQSYCCPTVHAVRPR